MSKPLKYNIESWYRLEVYPDGSVKIYSDHCKSKGAELSQWYTKDGYLRTKLQSKSRTVHSIVAEAFYGERPAGLVINHKDGNKLNNHPNNLEYCTINENIQHSIKMGFHVSNDPKRSGRYKDGRAVDVTAYKKMWYQKNRMAILVKMKVKYQECKNG